MKDKCDFCGASYVEIKTTKHEGEIKKICEKCQG
jgi:hypothetical protein